MRPGQVLVFLGLRSMLRRPERLLRFGEGPDSLGQQVDGVQAALQPPLDHHERLRPHHVPLGLVEHRGNDHVEQAVLVLEQQKRHPLGGLGSLPHHYQPRDIHPRAIRSFCRSHGRLDSVRKSRPQQPHRMPA